MVSPPCQFPQVKLRPPKSRLVGHVGLAAWDGLWSGPYIWVGCMGQLIWGEAGGYEYKHNDVHGLADGCTVRVNCVSQSAKAGNQNNI